MKACRLPPLKFLRECVRLERRTGSLFWRKRPRKHFTRDGDWKRWNKEHADKRAFCTRHPDGYRYGVIRRKIYMTHRVVWKLTTGKEPPLILDHKNGDRANNRFRNLRPASTNQNCMNRRLTKARSGRRGVYQERTKWKAQICVYGDKKYLGLFVTRAAAFRARRQAERQFFGEFAA